MYNEMILVVEKNITIGNFTRFFADLELEENIEINKIPIHLENKVNEYVRGEASIFIN